MNQTRQRIAVIGSGIAGLATAYFLNRRHEVVLYEAGSYLGGHTNTVDVTLEGKTCGVDTGFLVYNERTYPNFIALLQELGVPNIASDMSFAVSMDDGALEWAGTSLDTLFAQRLRMLSPSFIRMVADILHFNRHSQRFLGQVHGNPVTLGQLLQQNAYGELFRDAYLLPMAAAIWSSTPADILKFPAATFLRFCLNHALLQVNDRPQWRTVQGGARNYVQRIAATLPDCRLNTPVQSVTREGGQVTLRTAERTEIYDAVVLATHAPTSLAMLADASAAERSILGGVRYQPNTAWLHTDADLMPRRRKIWSAWNYLSTRQADGARPVCVTYWLNQLQSLPFETPVLVTLNPQQPPAADKVLSRFEYEHPIMDQATIDAQQRLHEIQGQGQVWHAGAWTGYGFHEDGLKSALRVAQAFDLAPGLDDLAMNAQLLHGQVMHERLRPRRHRFSYPVFYLRLNLARLEECNTRWFGVDRRRLVSLRTRDYGPRDGSSLEAWMRGMLREHDIAADGEIWLQTFPRIAGFVFNPVSFWHCHDAQGRLCAVLAEVNNTFGEHHRYLLRPDQHDGSAACAKRLHVSPFCQVEGEYRFRFRIGARSQHTRIDYYDNAGLLLKTAVAGKPVPLNDRTLLAALLRQPLLCFGIVARIHWQALRLWLKGAPFFGKAPARNQIITLQEDVPK